jgi:nicotinamide-nucleotide amidase
MTHPLREHRTVAIVSVGDELTLGQTLDTNGRWLAARLFDLGIIPIEHVTVPDDASLHEAAFRRLASSADLIVCTGGLGPTADDLTRQALARASGDELVEDPIALAQVEAFYAARGREMPALNRVQALRPSRGVCLANLNGTAPGLHATLPGGVDVFCLPGPASEMHPMFQAQVLPRLRPPAGRLVRTRVLHCIGIGESDLANRLGPLMNRTSNPLVGTTASGGVVSCRLRYEGPADEDACTRALEDTEAQVRRIAGEFIFGAGDDTLAGAILRALRSRAETVGTIESCTGGLLGGMLTDEPGSSAAYVGGLVTYTNALKSALAGVDASLWAEGGPGAVSAECVRAMATGGRERLGATHALAISGIAGPGGAVPASHGRPAKPVGTVFIARASADGSLDVRRFSIPGDRAQVRRWATTNALAMLRQHLAGLSPTRLLREVPLDA